MLLVAGFYLGYALNISSTLSARVQMWQSLWDNGARGGEQIAQAIWASRPVASLAPGSASANGLCARRLHRPDARRDWRRARLRRTARRRRGLHASSRRAASTTDCGRPTTTDSSSPRVLTLFLTLPVLVMGAGMLGLVPLTGVVTPFVSFGGSAMVANFIALGMLTAIRRQCDRRSRW